MHEALFAMVLEEGMDKAGVCAVTEIPFEPSLIELCAMNSCGNYGKNYTCPPMLGEIDQLIERAQQYEHILLFQKVFALEDSFDYEGMTQGAQTFREMVEQVKNKLQPQFPDALFLSAGGCRLCTPCGAVSGTPCPNPNRAIPSLEAHGMQVSTLAERCDMKYINGVNTTTFFGGMLF